MIGGFFLRSLVLCFMPTSDWAVEAFLLVNLKFDQINKKIILNDPNFNNCQTKIIPLLWSFRLLYTEF